MATWEKTHSNVMKDENKYQIRNAENGSIYATQSVTRRIIFFDTAEDHGPRIVKSNEFKDLPDAPLPKDLLRVAKKLDKDKIDEHVKNHIKNLRVK